MNLSALINFLGFVAGIVAYFAWLEYGKPWWNKRQAYKRRVASRKAKKVPNPLMKEK